MEKSHELGPVTQLQHGKLEMKGLKLVSEYYNLIRKSVSLLFLTKSKELRKLTILLNDMKVNKIQY